MRSKARRGPCENGRKLIVSSSSSHKVISDLPLLGSPASGSGCSGGGDNTRHTLAWENNKNWHQPNLIIYNKQSHKQLLHFLSLIVWNECDRRHEICGCTLRTQKSFIEWETFQKSVLRYKLRFNTENKYNSIRQREGKKSKEIIPDYVFVKYIFKWFIKAMSHICAENFSPRKYKYLKNLSARSVTITAV